MKSLDIDCDADTILAKVRQIGRPAIQAVKAVFYKSCQKEYAHSESGRDSSGNYGNSGPTEGVSKGGSYTSYLFDKGIDKILKKSGGRGDRKLCAAKNPDASELKYEISVSFTI